MDQIRESEKRENASALFKTLSSPLRVGIVLALVERPHAVSELVEAFGVSQPLVSQHLRVLRDQCLVRTERKGREVRYSLMDDHVAHIVQDAVEHVTEHDPRRPPEQHPTQNRKNPS